MDGQRGRDGSLQSSGDGISCSLLTKCLEMENDAVVGKRNAIIPQTMDQLFAPLPDSDSGFPTCN